MLLRAKGDLAGAETLYREALAMNRALYPKERFKDGHPHLAHSNNHLGYLLRAKGDLAGAETLYREALAMCPALYPKERFKDGHTDLAHCLNHLGALLRTEGRPAGARARAAGVRGDARPPHPRFRRPRGRGRGPQLPRHP